MANWRARVKLPASLDAQIRDHAVKGKVQLKEAVQAMIDDGVVAISQGGVAYQFTYPAVWAASDTCAEFEYVVDASYRGKVGGVTAGLKGAGKLGKALAECILIGARNRGIRA